MTSTARERQPSFAMPFGHSISASLLRPQGLRKRSTVPNLKRNASSTPSEGEGGHRSPDIALPQGVWWLKHAHVKEEAAYGESFVILRRQEPSTELVVAPQEATTVQVWHPRHLGNQLILRPPFHLLPPEFDSDALVVEVEEISESSALAVVGEGPVCEPVHPSPSSRRRTRKVKFTCNRCQTRTEKFVNPHAWNHGVVLCRCDGCNVVHLIRDEKGVFTCLKGPLFPPRLDPTQIKIPKGLPQNPQMPKRAKGEDGTEFWLF